MTAPEPCPFCRGEAVAEHAQGFYAIVWCRKCDVSGCPKPTLAAAIDAWNRRVPDPALAPGVPFLVDRADGVHGHYAVRRMTSDGRIAEHWSAKNGWGAFGDVFVFSDAPVPDSAPAAAEARAEKLADALRLHNERKNVTDACSGEPGCWCDVHEAARLRARAEKAEAALREALAVKTINLDEAERILDEVREEEDDHRARLRAFTVAACAVSELRRLTAALAPTTTEGGAP